MILKAIGVIPLIALWLLAAAFFYAIFAFAAEAENNPDSQRKFNEHLKDTLDE